MAELNLESLAVKEIIADIEKRKRQELLNQLPQHRQVRPNKRFLGRTIVSVLQHNRRQSHEEKRNSFRKLDELNRRRKISRSRSLEIVNAEEISHKRAAVTDDYERQVRLEMCFLGKVKHLSTEIHEVPKKEKKKKTEFLTIDLTKKKKKSDKKKKKRKKHKIRKKKIKSKKRRRRKDSTSSSSSSSSSSSLSSSRTNSISSLEDIDIVDRSPKLMIDLT